MMLLRPFFWIGVLVKEQLGPLCTYNSVETWHDKRKTACRHALPMDRGS